MSKIKVFLSHKHEFRESAKRLQWSLGRLAPDRFDFFASSSDIKPGDNWRERVERELEKADWLIALTTQCGDKSKEWIGHEISTFSANIRTDLKDESVTPTERRCIIIHDEGERLHVHDNLQQFPATKDGCQDFLRHLLSSDRGCYGFNPYVGNDISELKKEAARLWNILAASPPPYVLLPRGSFFLTPENEKRLDDDVIDDAISVTLNRMAAAMHNINLREESNRWEGTFGDLRNFMSENQRIWIPLMAFLLRKVLRQKKIQKAFILYPDYSGTNFYNPVIGELYVYPSGDMLFELVYFPVETAFGTRHLSQRDQLFHLIVLSIRSQWRLIDRYTEEVTNLAAKERSRLVDLTDEDKSKWVDLKKRIRIDVMKIHSESAARGIVNPEKILSMFSEPEREAVEDEFHAWMKVIGQIEEDEENIQAAKLERNLEEAARIVTGLLKKYAALLASSKIW
ncbi:MAG: hypothetical protein C0629_16800 [Chromatiales bacterium]|nr:toll/interleukin-1 receptor domain-containing protein [Chromatiales bacterium]PLX54602.1 MAG: hypothetical protein C0629_16800 [Chromatiales bacterium]